jgi:hypothetical protein
MDASRFDWLTRTLTNPASRRVLVRSLTAAALGLAATRFPDGSEAKKKRKKKLTRNAFGCVDVGGKCRGNSGNCCSGICTGKKPKQGQKDKSTCVAHNVGECQAGDDFCLGNNASCGLFGTCLRTTGRGSYCGKAGGQCAECTRDTDCEADFGPGAACVVCAIECEDTGQTLCVSAAPV